MEKKRWHGPQWPEDVPSEITGYQRPLFSVLDEAADNYPDHVYTIFSGAFRTFSQVKDSADRIARFLSQREIWKGDRVAIFLPNLPHYPAIYFGVLKAGAVCVTCNPTFTADELHYQLADSSAKAVFCMDYPVFYRTAVKAKEGTAVNEDQLLSGM